MRQSRCKAVALIILASAVVAPVAARQDGQRPYGILARVPWTASRIHGTPEPPPPCRTERAFAHLAFHNPLDIAFAPGSDRVFVAEQYGKIYSFPDDEQCQKADLFADLPAQVRGNWESIPFCTGPNQIYGFTFHPKFRQNHYVYICYILDYKPPAGRPPLTPKDEDGTRLSRFTVIGDPPRIDPKSEKIILTWFAGGHNGGCVKFGPDGYLYISTGDGADPAPPDKLDTGQDIGDLLSSVLRIDVDHPSGDKPYSIPPDNPFVHTPGARAEVYCYGLRNPWRMSFDSRTGNLWIADVGWELWESVYCGKPAGNYGWSIMEGPNPVHPQGKRGPTPITPPAVTLSHAEAASITGGFVYHGKKLPQLQGHYLFGDWQTRLLWAAKCTGDKLDRLEPYRTIAQTDQKIVAFGEPPDGEPLIVDHGDGGLWHIVPNEAAQQPSDFPRKLSQTGLFTSTKDQTPRPGVIPFSINAPQWLDGGVARRWVAVPGTGKLTWGKGVWGDDKPLWPRDSVLVRTIELELRPGDPSSSRKIETQILHFDGKQWHGYSYAWNERQDDADLVDSAGDQKVVAISDPASPGGVRRQVWQFASRAQCMTCHTTWCDYALAFNAPQLDRDEKFGDVIDNQVRTFRHIGLLLEPLPSSDPPSGERLALTNPYDESADLYERARSYLHANCSHCHRFGGGGSALFDVRKELPAGKMNLVDVRPNLGDFGIPGARIIYGSDPARSVLMYRMCKLGSGRMPHIGSDRIDDRGVELLSRWIKTLPGDSSPAASDMRDERHMALRALENPTTTRNQVRAAIEKLLGSTDGALALLLEVHSSRLPEANAKLAISLGLTWPLQNARDLFRRYDPAEQQIARLGSNINPARLLALRGDASRGRAIFFGQDGTGLCARCHKVAGRGGDFGPDLSHIATKYNRADLLDNILYPSKTIAAGYETYLVRTKSGDTYSGLLVRRSQTEIVLKDAQLKETRIAAADVRKMLTQPLSSMPEGLLGDLDAQQVADLVEFLASLR